MPFMKSLKLQEYDFNKFKELCYLWSSDFRTHITKKRWNDFIKRLFYLMLKLKVL